MRRSEHAACTPSPGVMIVHGGWDQFSGLQSDAPDVGGGSDGGVGEGVETAGIVHNDTFVVSLGSRLWSRIATGGGGPGAVRGASMSCTGGAAYLFGGHGSGIDFPGTIKVLSPNSTLWRMAPGEDWAPVDLWSNSKPPPLSYATMNQVSGNLYLFGGLGASRDASSVLWRFTPAGEGGKWDAMMATGVGRLMHSATTLPIPAGYHSVTPRQHHSTAARTPCCQPNPDPLQSLESEWRSNCLERGSGFLPINLFATQTQTLSKPKPSPNDLIATHVLCCIQHHIFGHKTPCAPVRHARARRHACARKQTHALTYVHTLASRAGDAILIHGGTRVDKPVAR